MALRKETVSALVKVISSDPEKLTSLVVKGFNKFGEEITETIMVPTQKVRGLSRFWRSSLSTDGLGG